jgi:glycosyltransferase involved in cell wall biosynthesis
MDGKDMTIGFDAKRIVRNSTGLGSYGRTLIGDLARHESLSLRLYAPDAGRDDLRRQVPSSADVVFCYPSPSWLPYYRQWWRRRGVVGDLVRDGVQLYHGLSGELPVGLRRHGLRSVVTIHDLIFLRHPEFYHWLDTQIYAAKFRQAVREADHIIAISECTKRDIIELGAVDEQRISVIYQSYAPRFKMTDNEMQAASTTDNAAGITASQLPFRLPRRYVLSVGSIERRKNTMLALKALHYLPEEVSLVLVGRHTPYTDELTEYAAAHDLGQRLLVLHGVSDDQLPAVYAGAETFVYPSVYEGFGIPIIEAVGCGLPVVACTGSCLEEAGGPDALYVRPDDVEGMANAIRQTLRGADGRQQRIERSRRYIRRFEGRDVAAQVIDLYRRLLQP